jgi:hypothetical protein
MEMRTELVEVASRKLLRQLSGAQDRIWLASPYLSMTATNSLIENVALSSAAQRHILTAVNEGSVRAGTLSPKALLKLRDNGFEVASIDNLHAKLSLVDSDWGLVGSGNLTGAGLGLDGDGNVELGIELDAAQLRTAEAIYAGWWDRAELVPDGELERLAALPRERSRGKGKTYGPKLPLTGATALDAILAEDEATAASRRYWIKANYHRQDLDDWWTREWITDGRRASYAVGDLIVLYLSAYENGPACCPAIVQATTAARHDPAWVIAKGDAEAIPQWPYVTETICVAEVPVSEGVDLSAFGKTPQSLQNGYCQITRKQFETGAVALRT